MKVYLGQTRSYWLVARLASIGWGECTCPDELPPRRVPWFLDNGAYRDYKAGRPWDEAAFRRALLKLHEYPVVRPDFIVAPDIVGGGMASLELSRSWLRELEVIAPVYLAVQDGMNPDESLLEGFAGCFVGGTPEWKHRHAWKWTRRAHVAGLPCHIGKIGSAKGLRFARDCMADSVDSAQPLWGEGNLRPFIREAFTEQISLLPDAVLADEDLSRMLAAYTRHSRQAHRLADQLFEKTRVCADELKRGR